jgi:TonB-linked SusC/RagA family outer membrane protein
LSVIGAASRKTQTIIVLPARLALKGPILYYKNNLHMTKAVSLLSVLMLFCALALAQTRTVTGTVRDAQGNPVPYASVVVQGTTTGASADQAGKFTIQAAPGAVLEFTASGFQLTKVTVSPEGVVNATLAAASSLNEVVVTALGVSRQKKGLGYATQSLNNSEITRGNNPNVATAIQGKIAGVEVRPSSGMPGASAQIYIRGARFFAGSNAPLYVVDGMPIASESDYAVGGNGVTGTDFSGRSIDIDPNDIETMTVLKGQAASSLYGTRASNGVIMITTKSGKGLHKGKPVVNVSSSVQADQISRLPDLQKTYAHGLYGAFTNFGSYSWGPEISTLPDDPTFGGNKPNNYNNNNPTDATKGRYWSPQQQAWVSPRAYDNAKEFFQTGMTYSNNVSVAQSFDMGNYYIGLGATNQTGVIPSSGMDRYTAKFSGDFNATSKTTFGINANFASTNIDKIPTGNNSLLFEIYGAPPDYDLAGTPYHEPNEPYKQLSYRGGTFDNPYWAVENNTFNEVTRRFFGNTYVSYTPTKGLNIRYQLGLDQYTTDREEIYEIGSASTGGLTAGAANPSSKLPSGGSITNATLVNRTFNSLLNLTYNKDITPDLRLTALVGNEVGDNYSRYVTESGTGFNIGGFHNISNTVSQTASESKYKSRTVGFYANAGLDWRSMVFLNLTGRNDIVSTMPSDNRSFFYPSASLAWVFSELANLKGKGFYGKIRTSYAEVGAPGTYTDRVYTQHSSGSGFITDGINFPFAGTVGYRPSSTLYDPNLKAQNTRSYEIGTELRFFNSRVGVEYTYVKQATKDQIFAVPLAGSTGFSQMVRNAGEMGSTVHEAVLNLIPVQGKDFQWNLTANYTKVINKVKSLAPGVENIYLGGFVDPQVRAAIGYTYPAIYGTAYEKNSKGQLLIDDDPNSSYYGMPLLGTDTVLGVVTPKFQLGVSNTLKYKFVQLSFLVDWKNGGQMYSGANRLINLYGTSPKTANRATEKLVISGVKASTVGPGKDGDPNDIVVTGADRIQDLYTDVLSGISEANVYGTSFVKLREVSLTFELPKNISSNSKIIKGASLSFTARNFLLWTELPNFDPESSLGNGNMSGGMDYMSLPQTKSYGVGLHLTF